MTAASRPTLIFSTATTAITVSRSMSTGSVAPVTPTGTTKGSADGKGEEERRSEGRLQDRQERPQGRLVSNEAPRSGSRPEEVGRRGARAPEGRPRRRRARPALRSRRGESAGVGQAGRRLQSA